MVTIAGMQIPRTGSGKGAKIYPGWFMTKRKDNMCIPLVRTEPSFRYGALSSTLSFAPFRVNFPFLCL